MSDPTYFLTTRLPGDTLRYAEHLTGEEKKVAEKLNEAADGSVLLAKRSAPGDRFNINFQGEMVTVSHIKVDGKWKLYNEGETTNLVIKVRQGDHVWDTYQLIEDALRSTRLGRALGYDAIRPFAKAMMELLGLENIDDWHASDEYAALKGSGDSEDRIQTKFRELLAWYPESGYDDEIGQIGAENDGVGYAQDAEEYAKLINGEGDGWGGPNKHGGNPLPLLSEPVYYAVAGSKDAGRGFRAHLEDLAQAIGINPEDM